MDDLAATTGALPRGGRVWLEFEKNGQVVGVAEVRVDEDGHPDVDLDHISSGFADAETTSLGYVDVNSLPTITVVIPTICKSLTQLNRTVDSILKNDYPNLEVIVVDNRPEGPDDEIGSLATKERVVVVKEPKRGISAARNRGVAVASSDIIAFTDDDALVDRSWLRALGERFERDDGIDAIGGLVLPCELRTEPQLWFEEFYGGFSKSFRYEVMSMERKSAGDELFPYAPGRFGAGCNMSFRKDTLRGIGGFDETLGTGTPSRGGEDLGAFLRVILDGGSVAFEPAALVRHAHRASATEFDKQVFGYGAGLSAMFTALVVRDPRQLLEIARRIPAGIRLVFTSRADRSPSRTPSYPRWTIAYQLLGIAYGPIGFLRSVIRDRITP